MDLSSRCWSLWSCCYWFCWSRAGSLPGSREVAPSPGVQWHPVRGVPMEYILRNQSQLEKMPIVILSAGINQLWTCWNQYGNTNGKMVRQALKLNCMSKINVLWTFASCCLKDTVKLSYLSRKMKYLNTFPIEQHIPEYCPYQFITLKQGKPPLPQCFMEISPSISELW